MEETSEELPNFSIGIDFLGPDPTRSKNKAEKNLQVARFANLNLNKKAACFDQPIGTFVYLCVRYENFALYHNKESFFAQILYKTISSCCSCAYVEILSTWEVWRALKRLELYSAAPRATVTPLSCSPNFPRAQYLEIRTPMYELIVKFFLNRKLCRSWFSIRWF